MATITREAIFDAADALVAQGQPPILAAVKKAAQEDLGKIKQQDLDL